MTIAVDNTFLAVPKDDSKDRINVEVGDSKQLNFEPQVKIMRWDNEVNFSLRLVHNEVAPVVGSDTEILWTGKKIEAKFYEVPNSEDCAEGGYEFEIILKEKPLTNRIEFTLVDKGVEYLYQAALTSEEIARGQGQPDNVVGSYAVYASEEKTNIEGGKLYRTGKVGHIYRPKITDSVGNWVWGSLNISNGILSVEIPQKFLDSAVYPVRHAAGLTIGYATVGASYWGSMTTYSTPLSFMRGIGATLGAGSWALSSISAAMALASAGDETVDLWGAVWKEDSGGANVHDLLASAENTAVNINHASPAQFYTITAASEALPADDYVISMLADGDDITAKDVRLFYDSGAPTTRYYTSQYSGAGGYATAKAVDPWNRSDSSGNYQISQYLTYAAGGTTYYETCAGAVSVITGAESALPKKLLVAGFTPTGSAAKLSKTTETGAVTPTGGVYKRTLTAIAGVIATITGAVSTKLIYTQLIAGTLTLAGDIKSFIAKKAVAGTLTPTGEGIVSLTKKFITGGLTLAGNAYKIVQTNVAGGLSFIGNSYKRTRPTAYTGDITPTGTTAYLPRKLISGTLTLAGGLAKLTKTLISGVITSVGDTARQFIGSGEVFYQTVEGTLTIAGDISSFIAKKTIAGTVSLAGALGTFYTAGTDIIYKTITGTLTLAGSTSNSISKKIAGTLTLAGHAIRKTTRTLLGAITFAGSTNKITGITTTGVITFVGSTNKITGITTTGVITFAGSLTTQLNELIHKLISGTLTIAGGTSVTVQKIVSGGLTFAGSISSFPKKLLTGVLTFDGNTYKLSTIIITGAITSAGGSAWLQKKLVGGSLSFSSILGLPDVHTLFHCPFGLGDGSTTFNLPDFRRAVAVGHDSGDADFRYMGQKGGEKQHTLTQAELPDGDTGAGTSHDHGGWSATSSHNHQPNAGSDFLTTVGSGGSYNRGSGTNATSSQYTNTEASHKHAITSDDSHTHSLGGSGTPFNVQQYYITVNKIIKT